MIIDQQIELYFGDDYPRTLAKAREMVASSYKAMVGWGANKNELMNNEGGRAGMLRTMLCHIIEAGDDEPKAFRTFNKYLAQTYTQAYAQRRAMIHISIDDIPPLILADDGGIPEALTASESESGDLSSSFDSSLHVQSRQTLYPHGLNQEEYELATILGNNNGSLLDAAQVLGWDHKKVVKIHAGIRNHHRRDDRRVVNPMPHEEMGLNGMHVRWHLNRDMVNPDCALCAL